MKDTDLMPWGKYKDQPMGSIPFEYLLRFYKKHWLGGRVLNYFERQLKILEESEERSAHLTRKPPKKYIIENYEFKFPTKNNSSST